MRFAFASSRVSPWEIAVGISSTKQVYPPSLAGSNTAVSFTSSGYRRPAGRETSPRSPIEDNCRPGGNHFRAIYYRRDLSYIVGIPHCGIPWERLIHGQEKQERQEEAQGGGRGFENPRPAYGRDAAASQTAEAGRHSQLAREPQRQPGAVRAPAECKLQRGRKLGAGHPSTPPGDTQAAAHRAQEPRRAVKLKSGKLSSRKLFARRLSAQQPLEEAVHRVENFRFALRFINPLTQLRPVWHAMREPGRELLHLAFGAADSLVYQHAEVGANHLVAIGVAR